VAGYQLPDVDDTLHSVLERLTRAHGPSDLEWLTARARKERRDARIDVESVEAVVESSTLLAWPRTALSTTSCTCSTERC